MEHSAKPEGPDERRPEEPEPEDLFEGGGAEWRGAIEMDEDTIPVEDLRLPPPPFVARKQAGPDPAGPTRAGAEPAGS